MSKIVRAVNSMILNQDEISNVIRSENTYFFQYKNKYNWSINFNSHSDEYNLLYYSSNNTLDELANMSQNQWENYNEFVLYSTKDIGTKEAYDTFLELYTIVKEKLFGINKVLDDIIGSEEPKDDLPF